MIVYIAKCKESKYYIGKTDNLQKRLEAHKNGTVSWTKRYPIIEVVDTIDNSDDFDEDKYTKIYMKEYGVENVRGGSYCQLTIPKEKLSVLTMELRSCENSCYVCGEIGHFSSQCKSKKKYKKTVTCYKCGKKGHCSNKCKVKPKDDVQYSSSTKLLKLLNRF